MKRIDFDESLGYSTDLIAHKQSIYVGTSEGWVLCFGVDGERKGSLCLFDDVGAVERGDDVADDDDDDDRDGGIESIGSPAHATKSIRRICVVDDKYLLAASGGIIKQLFLSALQNESQEDGPLLSSTSITNTLDTHEDCGVISVLCYEQGSDCLFVGNDDGDIMHFATNTGDEGENKPILLTLVTKYDHHDDQILDLLYVPTKKTLLAASGDGTTTIIDLKRARLQAQTKCFDQDCCVLALLQAGHVAIGLGGGGVKVVKWNYWARIADSFKGSVVNDGASVCALVGGLGDGGERDALFVMATCEGSCKLARFKNGHLELVGLIIDVEDCVESMVFVKNSDPESAEEGTLVMINADEPCLILVTVSKKYIESLSSANATKTTSSDTKKPSAKKRKMGPLSKKQQSSSAANDAFLQGLD